MVPEETPPEETPPRRTSSFARSAISLPGRAWRRVRAIRRRSWIRVAAVVVVGLVALTTAGLKWHEQPTFCSSVCHSVMAKYVNPYYHGSNLDRIHEEAGVTCLQCHRQSLFEDLSEVKDYVTNDFTEPLPTAKVPNSVCLKCHISWEVLANQTRDLARNPHASPHGEPNCTVCHDVHGPQ